MSHVSWDCWCWIFLQFFAFLNVAHSWLRRCFSKYFIFQATALKTIADRIPFELPCERNTASVANLTKQMQATTNKCEINQLFLTKVIIITRRTETTVSSFVIGYTMDTGQGALAIGTFGYLFVVIVCVFSEGFPNFVCDRLIFVWDFDFELFRIFSISIQTQKEQRQAQIGRKLF